MWCRADWLVVITISEWHAAYITTQSAEAGGSFEKLVILIYQTARHGVLNLINLRQHYFSLASGESLPLHIWHRPAVFNSSSLHITQVRTSCVGRVIVAMFTPRPCCQLYTINTDRYMRHANYPRGQGKTAFLKDLEIPVTRDRILGFYTTGQRKLYNSKRVS
jgi:hypothetical protein